MNLSRTERKRIERPWFTRGIQKSIETRQKYYIESLQNPELHERYTKHRNMVKRLITNSKRNVNKKKIYLSNNKSKAMWEVINTSLNKKPKSCRKKITKIKNDNNEIITDNKEIAEIFNKYFVGIGTDMANKIPNTPHEIYGPRMVNSLSFNKSNYLEVEQLINNSFGSRLFVIVNVSIRMDMNMRMYLSVSVCVLMCECVSV